jgi:WD40 repeat protein
MLNQLAACAVQGRRAVTSREAGWPRLGVGPGRCTWPVVACVLAAMLGLLAGPVRGQGCGVGWLPGENLTSVTGTVWATASWDPDGPGPEQPRLVAAGGFSSLGHLSGTSVAAHDAETDEWVSLGFGTSNVSAIVVLPNGDLVVGGNFTTAGGVTANRIARWNGRSWAPLGTGMNDWVQALAVLPNGDLIAAGSFTTAGGVAANRIARWNGSSWTAMGTGMNGEVYALAVMPNGDLIAGGSFLNAGRVRANSISRWNGSAWIALGTGMNNTVHELAVLPDGSLIAGGEFTTAGSVSATRIARWDGTSWSRLGSGPGFRVWALAVMPNGDLVAGGEFGIARWNGASWAPVGQGVNGFVRTLTVFADGVLVAGGSFSSAGLGTPNTRFIARWNGVDWAPLQTGLSASIGSPVYLYDLALTASGELLAAGDFERAGGGWWIGHVARWSGSFWVPLGSAMDASVLVLAVLPNGDVVAGGWFTTAGGVTVNGIARWNGSSWVPLGSGMSGGGEFTSVHALAVLPNGDLIASGWFTIAGGVAANNIARWNGSSWAPLGLGVDGGVSALAVLPNGDIVAGGDFTAAGGTAANKIARWNGSSWVALGSGMIRSGVQPASVRSLAVLPNGDLVAGGFFTSAGGVPATEYIASWNGSAWAPVGQGMDSGVSALTVMPNGELVAGGFFTTAGGVPANSIARWNGSVWAPLGQGVAHPGQATVYAMAAQPSGELAVGGVFTTAGGLGSVGFARYSFTGIPTVSLQPAARTLGEGQTLTIAAAPSVGYGPVSVQWQRNGVPIADGPSGASVGGGAVSGARGSAMPVSIARLTIAGVGLSDGGVYTAEFRNACGAVTSAAARVEVLCRAEYNRDGFLNLDDLADYVTEYYAQPAIPGGVQALAPTYPGVLVGFGVPCPTAGDAPPPYAADAYRVAGYRAAFSPDDSNLCPIGVGQHFPNVDNLNDFITAYYEALSRGGC